LEGHSGATPFARLLRAVAATKFERIKFTTSFPRDFHADILAAIDEHENLCNWVHLPVQSGSDKILRSMRRGHTVADYLKRVERLKQARRSISLTSDIIIGFPGETAADFASTVELVKRCQYDGLYIFKYSKRPGTPSEKLPDTVSDEEKSTRFALLEEVQKQSQQKIYHSYVGRQLEVLVEGKSAKSKEDLTGHSTCHKVVNFSGDADLIGRVVKVGVIEAKANSLYGKQLAQQS
jgi:tRNA-2-methylthio-N6-dimethylallyladenosine synthase